MLLRRFFCTCWVSLFLLHTLNAQPSGSEIAIDSVRLFYDLRFLSSDSLQGRLTGSTGARIARNVILDTFRQSRLVYWDDGYEMPFAIKGINGTIEGVNVAGWIQGAVVPDSFIVVSAHYDHVGVRNDRIYNGADDNASGAAALLELVRYFSRNSPRYSMIFVAFDAEEIGCLGSYAFVDDPVVDVKRIVVNVNMDMIARIQDRHIWVAGLSHYPFLKPYLENLRSSVPLRLMFGHDQPGVEREEDWTNQSDQVAFHEKGVPFLYFGVEDHPDYHRPTDDFERIDRRDFFDSVRTILAVIQALDQRADMKHP